MEVRLPAGLPRGIGQAGGDGGEAGAGCARRNAKLRLFVVADEKGDWFPAQATIVDKTVVVRSDALRQPIAVRYAYRVTPEECNLYNRDGLPASPFCSRPELLRYDPKLP